MGTVYYDLSMTNFSNIALLIRQSIYKCWLATICALNNLDRTQSLTANNIIVFVLKQQICSQLTPDEPTLAVCAETICRLHDLKQRDKMNLRSDWYGPIQTQSAPFCFDKRLSRPSSDYAKHDLNTENVKTRNRSELHQAECRNIGN